MNYFLSRAVRLYYTYVALIGHAVGGKNEILEKKEERKGKERRTWKGDSINHHHHHHHHHDHHHC